MCFRRVRHRCLAFGETAFGETVRDVRITPADCRHNAYIDYIDVSKP